MTTTPSEVRTYAGSPALTATPPPSHLLPPELRDVVAEFEDLKRALLLADAEASALHAPERDTEAMNADHALLVEKKKPHHVADLAQARAVADADLIERRRAVHEHWYDVTEPALVEHRAALLAYAIDLTRAAEDAYLANVDGQSAARDQWLTGLRLVAYADRPGTRWSSGGSVTFGSLIIGTREEAESQRRAHAEVEGVRRLLDALAEGYSKS